MSLGQTGWMLFVAAMGMMASLTAVDISTLAQWGEAYEPKFIARVMANLGMVITAFIGGKLIPEHRNPNQRTRLSDEGDDGKNKL